MASMWIWMHWAGVAGVCTNFLGANTCLHVKDEKYDTIALRTVRLRDFSSVSHLLLNM